MELERQRTVNAAGDKRPVVVLGAAGQLGETIVARFAADWPVVPLTRADLDLRSSATVLERLRVLAPRAIVNCAAYNLVDAAEDDPVTALEINAFVVRSIARGAERSTNGRRISTTASCGPAVFSSKPSCPGFVHSWRSSSRTAT